MHNRSPNGTTPAPEPTRKVSPAHLSDRAGLAIGIAALAGVITVSGCKVGPDYQRPESALNEAWLPKSTSDPAVAENVRWWESFDDPTLTALVQSAWAENLTLKQAGLRVLESRAARGISVGNFFPQSQNITAGIQNSRVSGNGPRAAGDRSYADNALGLEVAWELDFWGKFRRGIEAADAEVLLAVADYDAVLVSLTAGVASNYILIRAFEERLMFARANVQLQTETLKLTQARFDAGAVSELDVATARATLANTQALIPEFENALQQSKFALCVLLGRTPSDLQAQLATQAGAIPKVPDAPQQIAAGVPADLLRRRPDVRAAERVAAAQSARIGQAKADLYPSISIQGSTGFVSSNFESVNKPGLGNIFDANSFAGFIGLGLNLPILNYGRIENSVRVQDARYEQAVAAYQESVLRAAGEVEAGLSEFLYAKERTAYLTDAVRASNRSADLSLLQYRAGAVDFIRVNNAQSDLVRQQDSLVAARAAIALGAVQTYRALGGGWEIRQGQEFVSQETVERLRARTDWGTIVAPAWQEGKDLGFPRPTTATDSDTPTTPGAGK
ncbi:MAG: efflux transporter outer membrane subunit [bacterium]